MATQTTYLELNKPSGSDLVNPLVDTNPNWDKIDAGHHELDTRSIANATETVVLGVHAISRINQYTKFIKWIATANFTAGDTFTVDGNVVAAATPSGAALATGAYVTGAVVIACLNADDTAMTIFVSGTNVATDSERLGGELPNYYATASDMGSAQTDIGNIQALNGTTSIVGIGDGTLTGAVSTLNINLTAISNIPINTEIQIGTYNNKPLYRKVYTGNSISNATIDSSFNLSYIDQLVGVKGSIKRTYNGHTGIYQFPIGYTTAFYVGLLIDSDGLYIENFGNSLGTVSEYVIILDYTKN